MLSDNKELEQEFSEIDIQNTIELLLEPVMISWVFAHDIYSGKWNDLTEHLDLVMNNMYQDLNQHLLPYLSLIQLMIVVSPSPNTTVRKILDIYEREKNLKYLQESIIQSNEKFDEMIFEFPLNLKTVKTMQDMEFRLFTSLLTTETSLINGIVFKYQKELLTELPVDACDKLMQFMEDDCKRQIVHQIIIKLEKATMNNLLKSLPFVYSELPFFEKCLFEVADLHKDLANGKPYFRLKQPISSSQINYLDWFDPFFVIHLNSQKELSENLKDFKFDKTEADPILGDYKNSFSYKTNVQKIIAQTLAQSDLIEIATKIITTFIEHQNNKEHRLLELMTHETFNSSLKLLILCLDHIVNSDTTPQDLKQSSPKQVIQSKGVDLRGKFDKFMVSLYFEDFKLIKMIKLLGERDQDYHRVSLHILQLIYNIDPDYFGGVYKSLDYNTLLSISDNALAKPHQLDNALDQQKKKAEQLIEAAKQKRLEIMNKFKNNRVSYINKNQLIKAQSSQVYEDKTGNEVQEEVINCALCQEKLKSQKFSQEPYGQFGYFTKSKLLYHSIKQTLNFHYENIANEKDQEKVRRTFYLSEQDERFLFDDKRQGMLGRVVIKCQHYSHVSCLIKYLQTLENSLDDSDIAHKDQLNGVIYLNYKLIYCPLCRQPSNVLVPAIAFDSNDQAKSPELLTFSQMYLSLFMRNEKKIILTMFSADSYITMQDKLKNLMEEVSTYINHTLQLTSVKGFLHLFETNQQNTTIQDLATLMQILNAVCQETIKEKDSEERYLDFVELCLQKMKFKKYDKTECQLFETNLSVYLTRLMYYYSMLLLLVTQNEKDKARHLQQHHDTLHYMINKIYQLVQLQVGMKLILVQNEGLVLLTQKKDGQVQETGVINYEEIFRVLQEEENQDQVAEYQLMFLRKIAFMKLVINKVLNQDKEEDQLFISQLINQEDNEMECDLLKDYLRITNSPVKLNVENLDYNEDVKKYLLDMIDDDWSQKLYETYKKQLGKRFQIPVQLLLLNAQYKFNLIQLPDDYQTFFYDNYKLECTQCLTQPQYSAICLLCGVVCCISNDGQQQESTLHSWDKEGGEGLFVYTLFGNVVTASEDPFELDWGDTLYTNKYGDPVTYTNKWDNFTLDKQAYEKLRKRYMDFRVQYNKLQNKQN